MYYQMKQTLTSPLQSNILTTLYKMNNNKHVCVLVTLTYQNIRLLVTVAHSDANLVIVPVHKNKITYAHIIIQLYS